jgi:hypothetical protein
VLSIVYAHCSYAVCFYAVCLGTVLNLFVVSDFCSNNIQCWLICLEQKSLELLTSEQML